MQSIILRQGHLKADRQVLTVKVQTIIGPFPAGTPRVLKAEGDVVWNGSTQVIRTERLRYRSVMDTDKVMALNPALGRLSMSKVKDIYGAWYEGSANVEDDIPLILTVQHRTLSAGMRRSINRESFLLLRPRIGASTIRVNVRVPETLISNPVMMPIFDGEADVLPHSDILNYVSLAIARRKFKTDPENHAQLFGDAVVLSGQRTLPPVTETIELPTAGGETETITVTRAARRRRQIRV